MFPSVKYKHILIILPVIKFNTVLNIILYFYFKYQLQHYNRINFTSERKIKTAITPNNKYISPLYQHYFYRTFSLNNILQSTHDKKNKLYFINFPPTLNFDSIHRNCIREKIIISLLFFLASYFQIKKLQICLPLMIIIRSKNTF